MTDPNKPIETVFNAAKALAPNDQKAYLDMACKGDAALRREVERLLAAASAADGFFETKPAGLDDPGVTLADTTVREGPGTVIGRYKLLQVIGEGGMGVVYMAEQTEPVVRKVALKIIKLGMDTKAVVARFEAERQALALMDHPNIAKVLDAGATETGRPYFVMELVRGIPITEYCDKNHLSARQRLELFIPVCQAIQHAHQKGIIHRDIKPSNVLVTLHDSKPLPMVIDFGIAKATHQKLTEKTLFTNFAQVIGTPAYMSPEQAEMTKLDVDTRTDIYSLGVLLYELLTGTTPFAAKELMEAGYAGMQRIISEQEPPRPSTRLNTMQQSQRTTVAQNRRMEPSALTRLFQGDLDWVVMKCLEKERARRYETASALAADLQRHLGSEPVVARPPTLAYRFGKAVRRNRVAFAAGGIVMLALLLGVSVATWQAVRATRARTEALEAKAKESSLRVDAQHARDEAQAANALAQKARDTEQAMRIQAERDQYVSQMNLAQQAWSQNNGGRLSRILEATRRSPFRGFEWSYWQKRSRGALRVLRGHDSGSVSVALSPDGRRIATACSKDGWVKVWDAQTGRELLSVVGDVFGVLKVSFSPDGKHLASAGNSCVKVFDADNGRTTRALFSESQHSVAFSPEGTQIVTSSGTPFIHIWDIALGTVVRRLGSPNDDHAVSVSTSKDFHTFVSGHGDGTVRVWDVASGRQKYRQKIRDGVVQCVAFSPATDRFAAGTANSAEIWDASAGRRVLSVGAPLYNVSALSFSPDGNLLATGVQDGAIHIWDANTGQRVGVLRTLGSLVYDIAFSPDGRIIVAGTSDGIAEVWSVPSSATVENPPDLTLGPMDSQNVSFWYDMSFAEDGRRLMVPGPSNARIWDVSNGQVISTITYSNATTMRFSRDLQRVVWVEWSGLVHVTDGSNGEELLTLSHPGKRCWALPTPDGSRIVTIGTDGNCRVWDGMTGGSLGSFSCRLPVAHNFGLNFVFSPDGQRLAGSWYSQEDSGLFCLDVATGTELFAKEGRERIYLSVAFSSDGQRVVVPARPRNPTTTDGKDETLAFIWDASSGRELLQLRGHQYILRAAYSSDDRRILTGDEDDTVRVWDALGGGEVLSLRMHGNWIQSVAFSPDGRRIAALGDDGLVRLWEGATEADVAVWEDAARASSRTRAQLAEQLRSQELSTRKSTLLRWLVLSPLSFPTNITAEAALDLGILAHEESLQPRAGQLGGTGLGTVRWRPLDVMYPSLSAREVDGAPTPHSLAFAVCYLRSETALSGVALHAGTSSAIKVWLNGSEVLRAPAGPNNMAVEHVQGLTLRRGMNTLLVKVAADDGDWGSMLWLTDSENNPLKGVEVVAQSADAANTSVRGE
jgi:WD40 repeat protein